MSDPGSSSPASGASPSSLTPIIKALKTGDLETLSKLRHALRTPLNQIIGYSEMLMESAAENNAESILPDLKRIHSCGGQLLALINDALAPWRIDSGKIDFPGMRLAMHDPLAAILTQTGLCVEKSQASGHGELVTDLGKILSAAQNLEKLFQGEGYAEELIISPPKVGPD
ncbi:MAG TPA: histidine kinase dimerization/phospho-acceptor domain-containing protein, partial [Lacunisphaera sp.]|nr:histidine kinase dimerization/phospho-acceptor domain-containing protein [Lacunisphaera sp.]